MSGYENIVGGKLKLKGKALDVAGGIKKKKKKRAKQFDEQVSKAKEPDLSAAEQTELAITEVNEEDVDDVNRPDGNTDEHLTPAERRYMEQRERIHQQKLVKTSDKSHRDRIEDFNQYLANMSEHYDIPKVGPG
ncbi:hypothetical protein LIER_05522 [Lithospermum erythrorhizon]|uniref:Protein FAM32A-like n=1 Tax=Lithospermum erythrorhizon TaxID=34254 RepID=A0AAV3P1D3_LITER